MSISAAKVKELREKTGLPMMEVKKALEETGGDEAKAVELLRKKGLQQMDKRAGHATAEGRVVFKQDPKSGRAVLVEVLCETEPVAGTADFVKLGELAANAALQLNRDNITAEEILAQKRSDDAAHTVNDFLLEVVNRIRENIKLGRVASCAGHLAHYVHHDGKKGVLVQFTAAAPGELGNDVCMHIVAMRPRYNTRAQVDAGLIETERRIATEQIQGKPPQIVQKIVDGKIEKWFSDIVLHDQMFVKDDKRSVGAVLSAAAPGLRVERFARLEIGDTD